MIIINKGCLWAAFINRRERYIEERSIIRTLDVKNTT
jgi:hypothetical protein